MTWTASQNDAGGSVTADGVELVAEAEVSGDELVVRSATANLGRRMVYLMYLDLVRGIPTATLRYASGETPPPRRAPADAGAGWAELYSGGLGPAEGRIPYFPTRNAGEPIAPGTAHAVAFRFAIPLRGKQLIDRDIRRDGQDVHDGEQDEAGRVIPVPARWLRMKLQYAVPREAAERLQRAPARGFDLRGAPTCIVETWVALPQPLAMPRLPGFELARAIATMT